MFYDVFMSKIARIDPVASRLSARVLWEARRTERRQPYLSLSRSYKSYCKSSAFGRPPRVLHWEQSAPLGNSLATLAIDRNTRPDPLCHIYWHQ